MNDKERQEARELFKRALIEARNERFDKIRTLYEGIEALSIERDVTGTPICPGHPKICLGSGNFPGIECCCDECDHLARCLADGEEPEEAFLEHLCQVISIEVQKPDTEENLEWIRFCSDLLDFLTPDLFTDEELEERLQKIKAGNSTTTPR